MLSHLEIVPFLSIFHSSTSRVLVNLALGIKDASSDESCNREQRGRKFRANVFFLSCLSTTLHLVLAPLKSVAIHVGPHLLTLNVCKKAWKKSEKGSQRGKRGEGGRWNRVPRTLRTNFGDFERGKRRASTAEKCWNGSEKSRRDCCCIIPGDLGPRSTP